MEIYNLILHQLYNAYRCLLWELSQLSSKEIWCFGCNSMQIECLHKECPQHCDMCDRIREIRLNASKNNQIVSSWARMPSMSMLSLYFYPSISLHWAAATISYFSLARHQRLFYWNRKLTLKGHWKAWVPLTDFRDSHLCVVDCSFRRHNPTWK